LSYQAIKQMSSINILTFVIAFMVVVAAPSIRADERETCRPLLVPLQSVELGKSGEFRWNCSGRESEIGFYIVFIRPSGTYVLLKVPGGRNSFEFTPDVSGVWRWIVIHTDPDRSKPDAESEPGTFLVTETPNRN
jgi:hypothetical protein